jgi:histidine ammonia-lyase
VAVSGSALDRVRRAREVVERVLDRGDLVYGMNTGVGSLSRYRIPFENLEQFSAKLVSRHTTHQGAEVGASIVRAMMVTRVNGMAKGGVGVRTELVGAFVDALNAGVHPVVRLGGSVGQADLAEMAEIGQVLIGCGEAEYNGQRMTGAEALHAAGLQPIRLKAKEGLALISANGITMGHGSLVLADVADLLDIYDITAALSFEAFGGNLSTVHPEAARMRPHPGQARAADRLRELLADSYLWRPGAARNLQDPLSFRCVPQTHGACYDAHAYARGTMEVEINSASDNPLVLIEDQSIISVGNFDVVALAVAFDLLRRSCISPTSASRSTSGPSSAVCRRAWPPATATRVCGLSATPQRRSPPRRGCSQTPSRSTTGVRSPRASKTTRAWPLWASERPKNWSRWPAAWPPWS